MNKKKFTSKVFYEEQSKTYIDIDDNLLILKDGKTILRTSEQAGYNHIYTLNFDGTSKQVTQGKWDVIQFLGIDEDNGTIYYSAATQGPINEGIYKIGIDGSGNQAISSETGSNGATFSNGMKYFIKNYSDANTPSVYSLCDDTGKELITASLDFLHAGSNFSRDIPNIYV